MTPVVLMDRLARKLGYVPARLTPTASARVVRVVESRKCACQGYRDAGWKVGCPSCGTRLVAVEGGFVEQGPDVVEPAATRQVATPGECLTLGGHDGNPCSRCGRKTRPRPPAIPKGALERERERHRWRTDS